MKDHFFKKKQVSGIRQPLYFRLSALGELAWTHDCIGWSKVGLPDHNRNNNKTERKLDLVTGEEDEHRKKSFAQIWEQNSWGSESKSGPGSILKNTGRIREILGIVIDQLKKALNKTSIK